MKMNKKGTDKVLSVYWFAMLVLIAGGIVAMAILFYGPPSDVREIEGNLMINKVANCLSDSGVLSEGLFLESNFNSEFSIMKNCNLNFETEYEINERQYYLEVLFYDLNSGAKVFELIPEEGNRNFKADCEIGKGEKEYRRLVRCVENKFYSVNKDNLNEVYEINVLSAIGKGNKNVK